MTTAAVRRILVPVDLSSCSKAAFEFARGLAGALGAKIDVLYVADRSDEPALTSARGELREFLASSGVSESAEVAQRVDFGDARERIVTIADREGFDLIVLGTHGRTGRPRSLAGSVAESVVRTATRPVVTVREAS